MSKRPSEQAIQSEIAVVLAALPGSIRQEFPDIAPLRTFRKLSGGFANLVYELNDRFLLRMFFRQGWAANFEAERLALGLLSGVPGAPRILAAGTLPLEWPCPFLVLTKLPGEDALTVWPRASDSVREKWGGEIATLLRNVHAIPISRYGPLRKEEEETSVASSWQAYCDEKVAHRFAAARIRLQEDARLPLVAQAESYYARHREALAFQVGPRLLHGDVRLSNLIVDGDRVMGLVDWEWAHGGEPEEDLVNLVRFAPCSDEEYARLIPRLLAAYPEVAGVPDLPVRLTLYLIEAELGQMAGFSEDVREKAAIRLESWLQGRGRLGGFAGP